jgi:hypothetical protein
MRGSDALTATAIASGRTNSGIREQGPLCVCWERAGPGQTKGPSRNQIGVADTAG